MSIWETVGVHSNYSIHHDFRIAKGRGFWSPWRGWFKDYRKLISALCFLMEELTS